MLRTRKTAVVVPDSNEAIKNAVWAHLGQALVNLLYLNQGYVNGGLRTANMRDDWCLRLIEKGRRDLSLAWRFPNCITYSFQDADAKLDMVHKILKGFSKYNIYRLDWAITNNQIVFTVCFTPLKTEDLGSLVDMADYPYEILSQIGSMTDFTGHLADNSNFQPVRALDIEYNVAFKSLGLESPLAQMRRKAAGLKVKTPVWYAAEEKKAAGNRSGVIKDVGDKFFIVHPEFTSKDTMVVVPKTGFIVEKGAAFYIVRMD